MRLPSGDTARTVAAHMIAFGYGLRDGYAQPRHLSSSTNVDWLADRYAFTRPLAGVVDTQDTLDRGATIGQIIRSPRHHEYAGQVTWSGRVRT